MANKRGQGEGSISKRPDGTWWARVTLGKDENGKQKRKAFYGKTRKEVQEKMTAALNDVNLGTYIEPSNMTLEKWLDIWLKDYKKNQLRLGSYRNYWYDINNHISPEIGKCKLKDLRRDTIQAFANKISESLAPNKVHEITRTLKMALDQAVENELIPKNFAQNVSLPKRTKAKREVLTQEEQEIFINAAKNNLCGNIFILILATGLRIGEATALTWDDINFEESTLRISSAIYEIKDYSDPDSKIQRKIGEPKTKSSIRTIPLIPAIVDMLNGIKENQLKQKKEYKRYEDNNLIFCTKFGKWYWTNSYRKNFKKILEASEIKRKLTPHCLRHTFATRGLESGIPMKVMQELLGHASLSMTADLYTHVLPETKQSEMMKMENMFKLPDTTKPEDTTNKASDA